MGSNRAEDLCSVVHCLRVLHCCFALYVLLYSILIFMISLMQKHYQNGNKYCIL